MSDKDANARSSRLPGFYRWPLQDRVEFVAKWVSTADGAVPGDRLPCVGETASVLRGTAGLNLTLADQMIENVVGVYGLPLGTATNFVVNGRDVLVPMVVEEPSVVAGASFAAKLVRAGGGFQATASPPEMIGQIQILDVADPWSARFDLLMARDELLAMADEIDPVIKRLGGGARDLEVRVLEDTPVGPMLVVHLIFDCRDAMGANTVNTACEALSPRIEQITGGRGLLKIISNLADRRIARARCVVPVDALSSEGFSGQQVLQGIVEACAFAASDPYRAATHNKGIMNGVDAVVVATGNDWRAVEAGAHSYAARSGKYSSLSTWAPDSAGNLAGTLEMPLAMGIVGGATQVHPVAKQALKILGVTTARELAQVVVSVGLAQNLAALRALAAEGIQRGHMRLHARQVAIAAGAGEDELTHVVAQLIAGGHIRQDRAKAILAEIRVQD